MESKIVKDFCNSNGKINNLKSLSQQVKNLFIEYANIAINDSNNKKKKLASLVLTTLTPKYIPLQHLDILKKILEFREDTCEQITNNGKRCQNALIYTSGENKKDCTDYCLKHVIDWMNIPTKVKINDTEFKIEYIEFWVRSRVFDDKHKIRFKFPLKKKEKKIFVNTFQNYINILIEQNKKVENEKPKAIEELKKILKLIQNLYPLTDEFYKDGKDADEELEELKKILKNCIKTKQPFNLPREELGQYDDEPKNYEKVATIYSNYRLKYSYLVESNWNEFKIYYNFQVNIKINNNVVSEGIITFPELPKNRFIMNNWRIFNRGELLELRISQDNKNLYIMVWL
jgi:hypothetical protein